MEGKKKEGCPCGMKGKCCEKPELFTPEHEPTGEEVCEECYQTFCNNCGKSCGHEL